MGSLQEANPSLWIPTAPPTDYPSLRDGGHQPHRVDVAVVGSGITGLTTATLLKAAGATVAVIEPGGCARASPPTPPPRSRPCMG